MVCSAACAGSSQQPVAASPTSDSITRTYVLLVHSYWIELKSAEANAPTVCFGSPSNDVRLVQPVICRERMVAVLAVHQEFLKDLDRTPPPPQFAAQDRTFRTVVAKALIDVNAVISAANSGSKDAVLQATIGYVNDMIPTQTDALDAVDPLVRHD
jgi:hypothetical protein